MMKKPSVKVTVSNESKPQKYVTFSFDKMLRKGDYSFEYFKKNKSDNLQAYRDLLDKFYELSQFSMLKLMQLDKKQGFELIDICKLKAKLQKHCEAHQITKDSKVAIFRFSSQDYRMICQMDDNVFHVLAFDFDFSAYDHGS